MSDVGATCPDLLVRCHRTPCTLGEFADKSYAFLSELIPLHPGFAQLRFIVGRSKVGSPLLEPDLSNLRAGIFEYGWDHEADPAVFSELDNDGKPTANSRSRLGFRLSLSNWTSWDDKIDMSAKAGSGGSLADHCLATFPRKAYPEFSRHPLAGQLLEVFVKHWHVHYASYATRGWNSGFNFNDHDPHNMEIGWLNYVDDPRVAEALPRDVACKTLGAGVMFQLGDRLLNPDDPDDLALASRVKQALAAAGKLKVR
jgi:hypothetical protein